MRACFHFWRVKHAIPRWTTVEENMPASTKKMESLVEGSKFVSVTAIILFIIWSACFQWVDVPEGSEAVVIDKPWFFGASGVRESTVKGGQVMVLRSSTVLMINMQPHFADISANNVRAQDLPSNLNCDCSDPFSASVKFSYKFSDARAYALRGDPYWFTDRMDFVFRDRVIQEYAGFTRAEINDFPSFSQKMNANLLSGFNDDLRKAGIPVQILDVRVAPQPRIL